MSTNLAPQVGVVTIFSSKGNMLVVSYRSVIGDLPTLWTPTTGLFMPKTWPT